MRVQLVVGQTVHLNATNAGAADGNVTWASSNPAVATVTPGPSATGAVTGVAAGLATITGTDTVTGCSASVTAGVNPAAGPLGCALEIAN